MYLYEFVNDPKLVKLIAATDQLKTALENQQITDNWTVDKLLTYFRKFDLTFSTNDLYSMIQNKPLKNVVSNIECDTVVFKGLEPQQPAQAEAPPPEQSKEVVAKMAKSAMTK
jgi:hypothetical protein